VEAFSRGPPGGTPGTLATQLGRDHPEFRQPFLTEERLIAAAVAILRGCLLCCPDANFRNDIAGGTTNDFGRAAEHGKPAIAVRWDPAVTEIVKIPNRGHALTIDHGWREVAQTALDFVKRFA
jgi:hypothetical protein